MGRAGVATTLTRRVQAATAIQKVVVDVVAYAVDEIANRVDKWGRGAMRHGRVIAMRHGHVTGRWASGSTSIGFLLVQVL